MPVSGMGGAPGCQMRGCSRIFAIDMNPKKFEMAKELGATDCVNPKDHDKPIQQVWWIRQAMQGFVNRVVQVIVGMTTWGVDYTFDCRRALCQCLDPCGKAPATRRSCAPPWNAPTAAGARAASSAWRAPARRSAPGPSSWSRGVVGRGQPLVVGKGVPKCPASCNSTRWEALSGLKL